VCLMYGTARPVWPELKPAVGAGYPAGCARERVLAYLNICVVGMLFCFLASMFCCMAPFVEHHHHTSTYQYAV
jgi:hypothetical protein